MTLTELADFSRHDSVIQDGYIILLDNGGYLLIDAKGGAGTSVTHGGVKYTMITPASPLGQALLGKKTGDEVKLKTSRPVKYTVKEVL